MDINYTMSIIPAFDIAKDLMYRCNIITVINGKRQTSDGPYRPGRYSYECGFKNRLYAELKEMLGYLVFEFTLTSDDGSWIGTETVAEITHAGKVAEAVMKLVCRGLEKKEGASFNAESHPWIKADGVCIPVEGGKLVIRELCRQAGPGAYIEYVPNGTMPWKEIADMHASVCIECPDASGEARLMISDIEEDGPADAYKIGWTVDQPGQNRFTPEK